MLDHLGQFCCRGCDKSMSYRAEVDHDGACFVFFCDRCNCGDIYRIKTVHVRNIAKTHLELH